MFVTLWCCYSAGHNWKVCFREDSINYRMLRAYLKELSISRATRSHALLTKFGACLPACCKGTFVVVVGDGTCLFQ